MLKLKIIVKCLLICLVLFLIHCTSKIQKSAVDKVIVENDSSSVDKTQLQDSLDIRLVVLDSILSESDEEVTYQIINNSDYELSAGSPYSFRFLEFGFWGPVPFVENSIWTGDEYRVKPGSQSPVLTAYFRGFNFHFGIGRYKIEEEVDVLEPTNENQKEERPKVKKTVLLSGEFRIE